MTQHYQMNKRYFAVRDNFGSGDDQNNLLFRPHIDDDGYLGTDFAVIETVESHPIKELGLDPNAPDGARGLRFLGPGNSIWNCQYPTYIVQDELDDHIDGNYLVYLEGDEGNGYPFVDVGLILGTLYLTLTDTTLTEEQVALINERLNYLITKIDEAGMTGEVTTINLIPPIVTPPEETPLPEDPEPVEDPEPTLPPEDTEEPTNP